MTAVNQCDTVGCLAEALWLGVSTLGQPVQLCGPHRKGREKYGTARDFTALPGAVLPEIDDYELWLMLNGIPQPERPPGPTYEPNDRPDWRPA